MSTGREKIKATPIEHTFGFVAIDAGVATPCLREDVVAKAQSLSNGDSRRFGLPPKKLSSHKLRLLRRIWCLKTSVITELQKTTIMTSAQADQQANKKLNLEKATNFMRQYRDPHSRELKKLSANQFMEVWSHYDKDGNGYIEGTELDGFLREFVSSANMTDIAPEAVSDEMLVELKACFMEAYDDNQDGKIDIRELAQLLPMEENFLLLFRFDNPLESSVEFMKIWREYDTDGSGYIEADELKNFLRDLLKEAKKINDVSEDKLIEYTDTMLQVFDSNKDGRLQLSEMAKLLPVKENFLCRQVFKGATKLTKDDIERVFSLYDRDNNGTIENEELRGFLKDLLELVKKDYDAQDLLDFEETILRGVDYNQDGKINKKELTMILLAIAKHNQEEDSSA
ncbi:calbindin-32 isoform X2 [Onthophagus taurus]|uniref:calbindin-32 isoform X2 n=1 Tax=Onthophagus taurus TaxID=166361 RepID=UPI0039BE7670